MAKPLTTRIHQIGSPYIEHMLGAEKGKLTDLSLDIMSIGRAPDNDIIFPSESVSRCHAYLKRTAGGWLLQDNQSKNGIKKNGEKVVETLLRSGDVVQIGDFVFKFVEPGQPAGEPTVPRLHQPRPSPDVSTAWADEAFEALRAKARGARESVQFAVGIAAVVVISILIGFKLRNVFNRREAKTSPTSREVGGQALGTGPREDLSSSESAAARTAAPGDVARRGRAEPTTTNGEPIKARMDAAVPIDQNNPNEGRVVAEEVIDPSYAASRNNDAANRSTDVASVPPTAPAAATPGPATVDTPPPPPITLSDGLSKKDLQIKKPGTRSVTKDLSVYLQEGRDYLKEGDFESAALAFRFALVIDPNNRTAIEGIRAAEYRRKELPASDATSVAGTAAPTSVPLGALADSRDIPLPPGDRKQQVRTLLKNAQTALNRRAYQEAINNAERARRVEIRGETAYLNEAKQIIDRAKLKQKEDFDPFITRAKEKLKAGDYAGSKLLCEEMLRTDPAYTEARECVAAANEGLKGKK